MAMYYLEVNDIFEDDDIVDDNYVGIHVEPDDPCWIPPITGDPQSWWEPYGSYHIEADSPQEAIEKVKDVHKTYTGRDISNKDIHTDIWDPNEE